MKTFALIARRADHTRDAFRAHYEDVHAPLAVETVMEGTTRYVRHHLREEWFGAPDFDVLTAFWYREIAAAVALMERVAGPAGERIRQDEESFMDRARNTFFPVTEHPVLGQEDRGAGLLALALVRGPEPDGREAFVSDYEARWVPPRGAGLRLRDPAARGRRRGAAGLGCRSRRGRGAGLPGGSLGARDRDTLELIRADGRALG
jgi:hypothetical protein